MNKNFATGIAFVLKSEGGYINDPDDAGGETNKGITDRQDGKIDHLVDVNGNGTRMVPIRTLSDADAAIVYKRNYWGPICSDWLDSGLDIMAFDCSVNCGIYRATILLQTAAGVCPDGQIGSTTINACKAEGVLNRLIDLRIAYYKSRPKFWKYGKGWLARVDRCKKLIEGLVK